jgi:hypothetical protein
MTEESPLEPGAEADTAAPVVPEVPQEVLAPPPAPPLPSYRIQAHTRHEIEIVIEDRLYRLTNFSLKKLCEFSATIKLSSGRDEHQHFILSEINLARSRSRQDFYSEARDILFLSEEAVKGDLFLLMDALEKLQRENLTKLEAQQSDMKKVFTLQEGEDIEALNFLTNRDVLNECLLKDLERLGYVGDETGKKVLYLAGTSRKFSHPVSVLSIANSSAGKSFAQETVLSLMPCDEVLSFTRITPMSLSHFGKTELQNRILHVDELTGVEQDEAIYQLRSLISRGMVSAGYTSIDRQTGRMETVQKEVLGPVSVMTSTTHEELIDEETRSRFLILTTPEDEEQTRRVMVSMVNSQTREGFLREREREQIIRKYQVIQKVLRPLEVWVPSEWAEHLTFSAQRIAYKRRFRGFLSLLFSVALHRQHMKKIHTEADRAGKPFDFIYVDKADIEEANGLMSALYGEASPDLSPVNRKMMVDITAFCKNKAKETQLKHSEIPFSRRDLREASGWENTPCRRAFEALEQMEYIRRVYGVEGGSSRWYYVLCGAEGDLGGGMNLWAP